MLLRCTLNSQAGDYTNYAPRPRHAEALGVTIRKFMAKIV